MDNFKQITVFQFVNLSVDSAPSLTEIQFWVLANSFLGGWGEGGLWMGGYGISLHTTADLGNLRSGVFFFRENAKVVQKQRRTAWSQATTLVISLLTNTLFDKWP